MKQLDRRAIWLFFLIYGRGVVIVALVLAFFTIFRFMQPAPAADFPATNNLAAVISRLIGGAWVLEAVALALVYIWARLSYYFYRYELRRDEYRQESGIIIKTYVSIPYNRIQNVEIYRNLWERVLGLSDLKIETAGRGGLSALPEGRLIGLSVEDAEALRSEMLSRSGAAS